MDVDPQLNFIFQYFQKISQAGLLFLHPLHVHRGFEKDECFFQETNQQKRQQRYRNPRCSKKASCRMVPRKHKPGCVLFCRQYLVQNVNYEAVLQTSLWQAAVIALPQGICWPCLPRQGYCVQIHYRVQQLKGFQPLGNRSIFM